VKLASLSRLHSNVEPDSPVKTKLALVEALGFGGVEMSVGATGAAAATAIAAKTIPAAMRTPSRTPIFLALLAVLVLTCLLCSVDGERVEGRADARPSFGGD
jgi:hypothetical protein